MTNIRRAQANDIEQIIELCRAHAAYEQAEYKVANKAETLSESLFANPPDLYCLVVEMKATIVGYATFMRQFSTWDAGYYLYLDCLYLVEPVRGLGLGKKLMTEVQKEANRLSCIRIEWQTPSFNAQAIQFYKRLGAVSKNKERFFLT